jgi:mannose-6-phosphate isomerase-like protein (cupin superfamily)
MLVLEGLVEIYVGEHAVCLGPNNCYSIDPGTPHAVRAKKGSLFVVILQPAEESLHREGEKLEKSQS